MSDATAVIGISMRHGIGKTLHLVTSLLWLQHNVSSGDAHLNNIAGSDNCADALAKYLTAPMLRGHLARMSLEFEEGRADSAPQISLT